MTWFDRNPGGKKGPEPEPEKRHEPLKTAPEPVPVPATPARKSESTSKPSDAGLVGFLYKGSRVTGQLTFDGPARVDGSVEGEIRCGGTLTIGEGAEVRAKLSAQTIVIRGKVEGNVIAKEKVELISPARLFGNVTSPRLIITEGVVFDGDCSMGAARESGGVTNAKGVTSEKVALAQAPKLQTDSAK
jgi:cytoskeletal protein CcmA (bactofilin family)